MVGLVYEQLQSRIIQELALLDQRLTASNTRSRFTGEVDLPVIVLRLTQEEALQVQAGHSPIAGAIAYLHVPKGGAESASVHGAEEHPGETALPLEVDIPLIRTTDERPIPLYPMPELLRDGRYATIQKLVESILNTEMIAQRRTEEIRGITVSKTRSTSLNDTIPSLELSKSQASDIIVIRSEARGEGATRKGDWGVDLAIALYRLRSFLGQGWRAIDVDIRGRRV